MQTSVNLTQGVATLIVVGEVDVSVVHDLAAAIEKALGKGPPSFVIDLSAVTFCDSSGLAHFLHAAQKCVDRDVEFRIVGVRPTVREVFELIQTTDLLGD
jgi:anti-anti-sigma factor